MNGKNMIKAIATNYGGCFFRSRLEARWAIYFDAIGWKWNYEPEGFELPGGTRYLPDFWFPEFDLYAEIKPESAPAAAFDKATAFARAGKNILLLDGVPERRAYKAKFGKYGPDNMDSGGSLIPFHWKYGPVFVGQTLSLGDMDDYDVATLWACELANKARFEFGATPDRENICATAGWQFGPVAGRGA